MNASAEYVSSPFSFHLPADKASAATLTTLERLLPNLKLPGVAQQFSFSRRSRRRETLTECFHRSDYPGSEYSHVAPGFTLDPLYMQDVEDYYRQAGIVMPFISNDGFEYGDFVPGSGPGAVDIYGHDSYPLGFNCANTTDWTAEYFPTNFSVVHFEQSPSTPYAISEVGSSPLPESNSHAYEMQFQAGSLDSWGGSGYVKFHVPRSALFSGFHPKISSICCLVMRAVSSSVGSLRVESCKKELILPLGNHRIH